VKKWQKISIVFIVMAIISFTAINYLIHPQQNFVSAQYLPAGNDGNKISKTILINNTSVASVNGFGETNVTLNSSGIMYTAKFECGSIFAGEGPLRPGHYDTDVSIFNKQRFETTTFWDLVVNNGTSSNAILLNINPETSTGITCQDIRKVLNDYNDNFLEGFIIINVPFDSVLQSLKGSVISSTSNSNLNPLEIQVFYTANALDTLPREIIIDKISFYVIQDGSGKIPQNMFRKTLDISIPSTLNQISDTEQRAKETLAKQFNLTNDDLTKVVVRIKDVSVGVGVLIDDHAISLNSVKPELVP
jgi:hypothetical protein